MHTDLIILENVKIANFILEQKILFRIFISAFSYVTHFNFARSTLTFLN